MGSTSDEGFSTETELNITDVLNTESTSFPLTTTEYGSTTEATTTPDKSGLGGGAKAGIVIVVLLVIGGIAVAVFVLIKKRKIKNHGKPMKKASRKKWSQFLHRLTGHNQGRRQTAPSLDELNRAQQRNNNDDDDTENFQTQEQNNQGFQADVAQRLPMHKLQKQAPDIHISVNPEVSGKFINDLDVDIPSPDDHRRILRSGPHYDYPENQRGKKTLSKTSNDEDEGTKEDIYDHPQSPVDFRQSRSSESDCEETDEPEDVYDIPLNNKTITKSDIKQTEQPHGKPIPVVCKPVNKIATPSKDENDEGNIKEKYDYVNVEEFHRKGPSQHVRDSKSVQEPEAELRLPPRNKTTTKSVINHEDQLPSESKSVAHEHVQELATSSPDNEDNTEESTEEKRDYVNVEKWLKHGPPPHDRDSNVGLAEDAGPMDTPPPSASGHLVTHKRRYVNVPEDHELTVPDNSDHTRIVEATESDKADSHPYANAPGYANLPIGNPLCKNKVNDNADVSGETASLQEDTYTCADFGQ